MLFEFCFIFDSELKATAVYVLIKTHVIITRTRLEIKFLTKFSSLYISEDLLQLNAN